MPFGIIGRTGSGMRQVLGFGNWSTERGTFGANFGRAIVTNGDFTTLMCASASTVGAAVWAGACGGPRQCCIRWGSERHRIPQDCHKTPQGQDCHSIPTDR